MTGRDRVQTRKAHVIMVLVALVPVISGCTSTGQRGDVPVRYGQGGVGGFVIVQSGDALYKLADQYHVPADELIRLNKLKPPYNLFVGQRLRLPAPQQYRVQAGDTLYSVARSFGVEMSDLARANKLAPPYALRVGQNLVLPGHGGNRDMASAEKTSNGGIAGRQKSPLPRIKPVYGAHRTASAAREAAILSEEPVTSAVLPAIDQKPQPLSKTNLSRPQADDDMPTAMAAVAPPVDRSVDNPVDNINSSISATASSTGREAQEPLPEISRKPPPHRAGRFIWPVNGRVISEYGPKEGGLHNDGVNIAAQAGSPVRAAENGVVAYAGDELKGFGNLLLVRHSNGWMTAYAHLDKMLVKRGQTLTQGQVIGTVGKTGSVDVPQLHFEIRRGTKALDPADYLERQGFAG